MPDATLSAQQIDEAGRYLRLALENRLEGKLKGDTFASAIDVVWDHRKSFTGPLATAAAKLRVLVAEVAETAEPPYKLATEEQGGELDEAFRRDFEVLREEIRLYFVRHDS